MIEIDGRKPVVLAVEDDPSSAEVLRGTLETAGCSCLVASNAAQALRMALKTHVDLILTDLALEGIDGVHFLQVVRELEIPAPVVVVSAFGTQDRVAQVAGLGVMKFLAKPVDRGALIREVRRALPREVKPYALLGAADRSHGPAAQKTEAGVSTVRDETRALIDELSRSRIEVVELRSRLVKVELQLKLARQEAEEVKESLVSSTRALMGLLNNRDVFSGSHGARVADYSLRLARRLLLPESTLRTLEVAALLHDIGKIALPEGITNKNPEVLSNEERAAYMRHPELGQSIISYMVAGDQLAKIVRSHHESFDGSGFPDGLKSSAIPLEARIMAAANALDRALTAKGDSSLDFSKARKALSAARGAVLDPLIAEHALQLVDELEQFHLSHVAVAVPVGALQGGEVLAADVIGSDGLLFLPKGTILTKRYRDRLEELALRSRSESTVRIYKESESRVV